jgi:hypothetical protein
MVKSISSDYSCEDVDVYSWFRGFYFLDVGNFGRCDGDECGVTWQIHADQSAETDLTRIELRNNPAITMEWILRAPQNFQPNT